MVRGIGQLADPRPRPSQMTEKDFVVLPAIASYCGSSRRGAGAAARRLGLKLDLRRARPDGHGGLDLFPPPTARSNDWELPLLRDPRPTATTAPTSASTRPRRFFDAEERGYLVILASDSKGNPLAQAVVERAGLFRQPVGPTTCRRGASFGPTEPRGRAHRDPRRPIGDRQDDSFSTGRLGMRRVLVVLSLLAFAVGFSVESQFEDPIWRRRARSCVPATKASAGAGDSALCCDGSMSPTCGCD